MAANRVSLGGIKNPYLDPAEAMRFNNAYMGWKAAVAFRRLKGEKYQVKGAASRGNAMPEVDVAKAIQSAAEAEE